MFRGNTRAIVAIIQLDDEDVEILDKNGNELADTAKVGTGCTVKCGDEEYTVIVPGDIEGDGVVSAADARLVLRHAAELTKLDDVYLVAANVNGDSTVNAADARKILRVTVQLEKL